MRSPIKPNKPINNRNFLSIFHEEEEDHEVGKSVLQSSNKKKNYRNSQPTTVDSSVPISLIQSPVNSTTVKSIADQQLQHAPIDLYFYDEIYDEFKGKREIKSQSTESDKNESKYAAAIIKRAEERRANQDHIKAVLVQKERQSQYGIKSEDVNLYRNESVFITEGYKKFIQSSIDSFDPTHTTIPSPNNLENQTKDHQKSLNPQKLSLQPANMAAVDLTSQKFLHDQIERLKKRKEDAFIEKYLSTVSSLIHSNVLPSDIEEAKERYFIRKSAFTSPVTNSIKIK